MQMFIFFFNDTATTEIYTLSLHDALPISSVCRMTFPILASLLVRLVVLLPFQLHRLSLATSSRWTPLALSVFLHCVVALLLTLLYAFLVFESLIVTCMVNSGLSS